MAMPARLAQIRRYGPQAHICVQCGKTITEGQIISGSRNRDNLPNFERRFWHEDCNKPFGYAEVNVSVVEQPAPPAETDDVMLQLAQQVLEAVRSQDAKLSVMQSEITTLKSRIDGAPAPAAAPESELRHKQMGELLETLLDLPAAARNVYLVGPAGSGKTHAGEQCARLMGLPFASVGSVIDRTELKGFTDASGRTLRRPFRDIVEHGGVFMFDEIDTSDPRELLAFNTLLANGHVAFDDAVVKRHAQCYIIACANTVGQGSTAEYIGRNKLDATTLDRFAFLRWEFDEALEREVVMSYATDDTTEMFESLLRAWQDVRKAASLNGVKAPISMRPVVRIASAVANGRSRETAVSRSVPLYITEHAMWSAFGAALIRWAHAA